MHAVSRIALLAALTLVAGCGGAERPAAAIAPRKAAAPPPAVTAQPVANVVAKIADFEYRPRTLRIVKGTRVTWKHRQALRKVVARQKPPPIWPRCLPNAAGPAG